MTGQDVDKLNRWLGMATKGWHTFPLRAYGKAPAIPKSAGGNGYLDATTDRDTITAWWRQYPACNIGLHPGPSGIVVIDVDVKARPDGTSKVGAETYAALLAEHGQEHTETYTVRTWSGGAHYYYALPDGVRVGSTNGTLGPDIDIRSHDGYVVAEGGVYDGADGSGEYVSVGLREPARCPEWLVRRLVADGTPARSPRTTHPRPNGTVVSNPDPLVLRRVEELARALAEIPDGQANDATAGVSSPSYMVGQYVAAGQVDAEEAKAVMRAAVDGWAWRRPGDHARICRRIDQGIDDAVAKGAARRWEPGPEYANGAGVAMLAGTTVEAMLADAAQSAQDARTRDGDTSADAVTAMALTAPVAPPEPRTLADVRATYRKWLGPHYDLQALDAVLSVAAVEQLTGDPVWLLTVGGPGTAKTETVLGLGGARAHVISTITSEGALLSATPARSRQRDATGGLLRKIGKAGVLVIKDVTSILSMNRDMRAQVLAALREVYDGRWVRNVGTDGGRTLEWVGRIVLIGAVTTAWDQASSVIATMGERFLLVRMDSRHERIATANQALGNVGHEEDMRREISEAVGGLLLNLDIESDAYGDILAGEVADRIVAAANAVALIRSPVERDIHAPESPTRMAKALGQVVRGAMSIGLDKDESLNLALRIARDTCPPSLWATWQSVRAAPGQRVGHYAKGARLPRQTVDQQLQILHGLGLVDRQEEQRVSNDGRESVVWTYRCTNALDPSALDPTRREVSVGMCVGVQVETDDHGTCRSQTPRIDTDISRQVEVIVRTSGTAPVETSVRVVTATTTTPVVAGQQPDDPDGCQCSNRLHGVHGPDCPDGAAAPPMSHRETVSHGIQATPHYLQ